MVLFNVLLLALLGADMFIQSQVSELARIILTAENKRLSSSAASANSPTHS